MKRIILHIATKIYQEMGSHYPSFHLTESSSPVRTIEGMTRGGQLKREIKELIFFPVELQVERAIIKKEVA